MITRKVIAIAVLLPLLIAPAIAQQHQGGPQSTVPHDMRQPKTSNVDNTSNKKLTKPSKASKKAKAAARKQNAHQYQGGPKSAEPHKK